MAIPPLPRGWGWWFQTSALAGLIALVYCFPSGLGDLAFLNLPWILLIRTYLVHCKQYFFFLYVLDSVVNHSKGDKALAGLIALLNCFPSGLGDRAFLNLSWILLSRDLYMGSSGPGALLISFFLAKGVPPGDLQKII